MVIHVCLDSHRFTLVREHVFFNDELYIRAFKLVKPVAQLRVEHLFTVLFEEVEISVLAAQQNCSVDLKHVLQDFTLVHLHAGKYLLPHKACLNLIERGTVDEPWQVNRDRVTLECGSILRHVVGKEVIIIKVGPKICLRTLAVLGQVIVTIIEKVWLFVSLLVLFTSCLVGDSVLTQITIWSLTTIIRGTELASQWLLEGTQLAIDAIVLLPEILSQKLHW